MPIYEYCCKDCEQIFEEWQKAYDVDEAECPVCGGQAHRIVSNTTFVLKGGGWYVSEYGRNSASSTPTSNADTSGKAASSGNGSSAGTSGNASGNASESKSSSSESSGSSGSSGSTAGAAASGGSAS